MLFVDILPWNLLFYFLTHTAAFQSNFGFLRNLVSEIVQTHFSPKNINFHQKKIKILV